MEKLQKIFWKIFPSVLDVIHLKSHLTIAKINGIIRHIKGRENNQMNHTAYKVIGLNKIIYSHKSARAYYARGYEIAVLSNRLGFWEQLQLWVH